MTVLAGPEVGAQVAGLTAPFPSNTMAMRQPDPREGRATGAKGPIQVAGQSVASLSRLRWSVDAQAWHAVMIMPKPFGNG